MNKTRINIAKGYDYSSRVSAFHRAHDDCQETFNTGLAEIYAWCEDNILDEFFIGYEYGYHSGMKAECVLYILFYNEASHMAFKLRWL